MSDRFPGSMHRLKARFPKAERLIQVRIFNQEGDTITIEGPCTNDEAKAILAHAIGSTDQHKRSEPTGEPR